MFIMFQVSIIEGVNLRSKTESWKFILVSYEDIDAFGFKGKITLRTSLRLFSSRHPEYSVSIPNGWILVTVDHK